MLEATASGDRRFPGSFFDSAGVVRMIAALSQ
jgi:hypothetical protein